MKKTVVFVLILTMLLSACAGCSSREIAAEYIESEIKQDAESKVRTEEERVEEEPAVIPEESETAEETPEATPEEKQESAVKVDTGLYLQLFEEGISMNEYSPSSEAYQLSACSVLANDPADFGTEWNSPRWITRFLVHDLNDDGVPELVLQTGEVEQYMYIFTIRENAVYCTGFGYMDNQNGTDYLTLYRNHETGEIMAVSEGGMGSGAGSLYFTQYIRSTDLSCQNAAFTAKDDVDLDTWEYVTRYYLNDAEVSEGEYQNDRDAFFAPLTVVDTLNFQDMGRDPVSTLRTVLENT